MNVTVLFRSSYGLKINIVLCLCGAHILQCDIYGAILPLFVDTGGICCCERQHILLPKWYAFSWLNPQVQSKDNSICPATLLGLFTMQTIIYSYERWWSTYCFSITMAYLLIISRIAFIYVSKWFFFWKSALQTYFLGAVIFPRHSLNSL